MTEILSYQIDELIHESSNSLVYRARREVDDQPVVLKMLKEAYPSPERIAWKTFPMYSPSKKKAK